MDIPAPDGFEPRQFYSSVPPSPHSTASDATASDAGFDSGLRTRPGLFICALGGLEASIAGIPVGQPDDPIRQEKYQRSGHKGRHAIREIA